jgi:microcin C transport system substrate-binding protein
MKVIRLLAAAFAIGLVTVSPRAQAVRTVHSMALVGTPALSDDYKNFPWVNPAAPKGGEAVVNSVGTFDSFNPFILRGTPAPVEAVWETLMADNPDEPSVEYGRLAEAVELPADKSWVAFDLRPEAKFWDGTPVTADDVAWTFNTLRDKGRPTYAQYYADVDHVEIDGARRVVFRFKTSGNRELPFILGQLQVLPKHWWATRDFSAPLTDPPLGSGPYLVGKFEFGRSLTMQRVPDYWGRDMPFERGLDNFDSIRTEFYRDRSVDFEAFKSGQSDFREEHTSRIWATGYDFPALKKGLVRKETFPQRLPTGMQAFAMNLRRPLFADRRVRQAMAQVFDFEWTNKTLFYGLYARTSSYFSNSEFASSGLPTGDELALLTPFRDRLPPDLFTTPFILPVTDGSGNNPQGLRHAYELLRQAGYSLRDHKLVDAKGQPFGFEILLDEPAFERIVLPYAEQLRRLGMDVRVRTVDPAQYQHRLDAFDYDMTVNVWGESDSPGNEQTDFWTCAAAKSEGSGNVVGICDPVVDAMVGRVISAQTKPQLLAAVHALDRVLLWGWYTVPQWHVDQVWVAYWDRFGRPTQPVRPGVVFGAWWVDPALAAKTDAARAHGG